MAKRKKPNIEEEYKDIFSLMKTNPVGLRRKIATTGFFAIMPIEHEDDYRFDEQTFIRTVFRWVLDRALLDSLGGAVLEEQKAAYNWAFIDNDDFDAVCDYADIPPDVVKEAFKKFRKAFKDSGVKLFP